MREGHDVMMTSHRKDQFPSVNQKYPQNLEVKRQEVHVSNRF